MAERVAPSEEKWLTGPVAGIGIASFFSDAGHEIPTSLLPRFLTTTLSASPAALGLVEGVADGVAGIARLLGGGLADDPERRRRVAVGGYTTTAVLSSAIGMASSPLQVGALRAGAWAGRGIRGPSRNALLAELAPAAAYGRAFGFERAMDNFGAIVGPLLAVVLVEWIGVRHAIEVSVIPGLLAAVAIFYAARRAPIDPAERVTPRPKLQLRPVLRGELGRLLIAAAAFELGNVAATLFILRATVLLQPGRGLDRATSLAVGLYVLYNAAAALGSIPAGRLADRLGNKPVLVAGPVLFVAAYSLFGVGPTDVVALGIAFVLAGAAVACSETAQSAAVASIAPDGIRGSAFGVLATVQSVGNLVASGLVGLLWASGNVGLAFVYADGCMLLAVVLLLSLVKGALRAEVG
jgi:MFS family permease